MSQQLFGITICADSKAKYPESDKQHARREILPAACSRKQFLAFLRAHKSLTPEDIAAVSRLIARYEKEDRKEAARGAG